MRIAAIAASCVIVAAVHAQTPLSGEPRPGLPERLESPPHVGVAPLSSRTVLGVVVGKDSLADVKQRLGNAPMRKMESEGRPQTVCYRSNRSDDDTVVIFEAGPLGGFRTTTAVTVGPASRFRTSMENCVKTSKVTRASAHAGRLRLGDGIDNVSKAFNVIPAQSKTGLTEIALQKTVTRKSKTKPNVNDVEVDVSSGIVVQLGEHGVQWYVVYYTESL